MEFLSASANRTGTCKASNTGLFRSVDDAGGETSVLALHAAMARSAATTGMYCVCRIRIFPVYNISCSGGDGISRDLLDSCCSCFNSSWTLPSTSAGFPSWISGHLGFVLMPFAQAGVLICSASDASWDSSPQYPLLLLPTQPS